MPKTLKVVLCSLKHSDIIQYSTQRKCIAVPPFMLQLIITN